MSGPYFLVRLRFPSVNPRQRGLHLLLDPFHLELFPQPLKSFAIAFGIAILERSGIAVMGGKDPAANLIGH